MSRAPEQWTPGPRGQCVASAVGAIAFVVFIVMFVHQPAWLPGLAAALMLLTAVTSFGVARSRAARKLADKTP